MRHTHLLHDAMDAAAMRAPDAPAFVLGRAGGEGDSDALSYRELVARSDALARVLAAEGVQRGDRVGILAPKSLRCAVAIYGIMKAGAAYVPIDPAAPVGRLAWLLDDCGITHLITDPSRLRTLRQLQALYPHRPQALPTCVIGLDDGDLPATRCISWKAVDATTPGPAMPPGLELLEDDLAYIIYTSGSTGVPKGIMHTHRSGLAYARLSADVYDVQPGDRLGNHSPLHFDISTFDVFTGPACGATTVIIPEVVTRLPASLSALIEHERLTIWYSVASALGQLLTRGVLEQRDCSALRWVLFGGDLLSPDQLRALQQHLPGARFSNSYGPAEVNQCTYYHLPAGYEGDRPLPIGRVWPNTEGLVLDDNDAAVADGAIGELVIRSATQMRGYWNRPDLNATAFYYRGVHGHYEDRFYRTGDLVRFGEDGELEFHGRKDRQIKTRGYRVELDEVETALATHPLVDEAAALPRPDPDIGHRIEAAVTWAPGPAHDPEEQATALASVRKHLRKHLPAYAVPARVEALDAFPRTPTGKIDRNALADQIDARTTTTKTTITTT